MSEPNLGENRIGEGISTEQLWREISSLKELLLTRVDAIEQAVKVSHADLVRVPTDVQKEVGTLKELHECKFNANAQARDLTRNVIETRLDGMDKAIRLLQDTSDKFPDRIDEKIIALEKVHGEKFGSIDKQFAERDVRTQQSAEAATTAVNAALQAQKESAGKQAEAFQEATQKSEQQFTKQIDQQGELLKTEVRGLTAIFNELKDRFNRGEGKVEQVKESRVDSRASQTLTIGLISLAVAIVVAAFVIAPALRQ